METLGRGSFSLKGELDSIGETIAKDTVGIIAKSVGTRVCMNLIPKLHNHIKKNNTLWYTDKRR